MMYEAPPTGFPVSTLEYRPYTPRCDQMNTCFMVGLAAIVVYLLLARPQSPMYHPMAHQAGMQLTSMVATVGNAVSARAAAVTDTVVAAITTTNAGSVMPASGAATTPEVPAGSAVKLLDCPKSKTDANAWKSMSETDKGAVEKDVRAFLTQHQNARVMLFAPWCSHCHTAMPVFAEAAKAAGQQEFVMINAESLPRSAFQGEDKLCQLDYFPTFGIAFRGVVESRDVQSPAELVDAPAPAALAAPAQEENATEAMFRQLF